MAIAGVVGIFFCLYCIYDGVVAYPAEAIRHGEFIKKAEEIYADPDFVKQREQNPILAREKIEESWAAFAEERDWPTKLPKERSDLDILGQFGMAGAAFAIAIPFLFILIRSRRRWMEADENGLRTSWGPEGQFDEIDVLDKKKWQDKGIAYVRFGKDRKKITLDDMKFDRDATEQILQIVEDNISPEQIVNGLSEKDRVAQKKADEASEAAEAKEGQEAADEREEG